VKQFQVSGGSQLRPPFYHSLFR